ncbi:MAG: LacI family DNA-binding transcriptional regulator [Bacillota bacterium]|nr:LacI family DNA-binding transcriptional regulator [Bacillota bacterium]
MNIKEIAKKAGVSVATVSRVLNHPESVAVKTREKIQKIIDEEEYTPNWFAQGLNFNKTKTIGLVLPHTQNSTYMEIANGVEEVARQKGYITFMCNMEGDPELEKEYIDQLVNRKVDGIILLYSLGLDDEYTDWIDELNMPVVTIGESKIKADWDSVKVDCRAAMAEMTAHLMECGHKKIGVLRGTEPDAETKNMVQGFRNVLKASGNKVDEKLIYDVEFSIEGGYIGMKKMIGSLPKLPDAVITTGDEIAYGAMDAIKETGFNIPDDVAVTGFGNDRMSSLMEPKLTTVELPYRKMGIYGARILFDHIDEKQEKKNEKHVARKIKLQAKSRIRKSCGHEGRIGEMF